MTDATTADAPSIEPEDLYARIVEGESLTVLDLRNRDETEEWRIDAPSIDFEQVSAVQFVQAEIQGTVAEKARELGLDPPIVVVCAAGRASAKIALLLERAGLEAANLAGGMEAWARLAVSNELEHADADARIVQYLRPSSGCLSYLVVSGEEAVVVDPLRAFVDRYVEDVRERDARIAHAIDTHVHADHLSGVRELADRADATPVLPAGATDRDLAFDATLLEDGETIEVGSATIEAVAAPGHTTEMTALRVGDVLLSGDSLFVDSVARPDLERGAAGARDLAETLYDTLHDRLLALPDETTVAPGHVDPTSLSDGVSVATLADLRANLVLLGLDREAFVERVVEDLPPRPANYERIIETNLGRAEVTPDQAFELELGPNNCAVST